MKQSSVIGKIVITGKLVLKSPLLIGSGASEGNETNDKDIHVIKDQGGNPFIPGTSFCGVLREYMTNADPKMVNRIFGDSDLMQSSIQFEDITLKFEDSPQNKHKIIFRDGVKIDSFTDTGVKGGKYNYEAVDRGAYGDVRLLVTLRGCHIDTESADDNNYTIEKVKNSVAGLLKMLEDGIRLGALTSKGFGQVQVENIKAGLYDFRNKADVASWLKQDTPSPEKASTKILPTSTKILVNPNDLIVDADFAFNSSFIIKDYDINEKIGDTKVSAMSLYSKQNGDFIIPGTSLKGVFRHRAEYILQRFGGDAKLLDNLMGSSNADKKIKSRFIVSESYVSKKEVKEMPYTRNRIDRFTGGTLQGMLFTTKPVWQKEAAVPALHIHFEIQRASEAEVGLALFLLRDLSNGSVAIGGEKSVGRGTLKGLSAKISYAGKNYELNQDGKVTTGEASELSKFAGLVKHYAEAGEVK